MHGSAKRKMCGVWVLYQGERFYIRFEKMTKYGVFKGRREVSKIWNTNEE